MGIKARKTYRLEVQSDLQVDAIEHLTRKYIVQGKNLTDAISEYAINVYNKDRLKQPETLVTEVELINAARELGLTVAKSSIVQYRRKGVLKDSDGPWFFQNSQNKLVYNLQKMIPFLRERAAKPRSRITNAPRELPGETPSKQRGQ